MLFCRQSSESTFNFTYLNSFISLLKENGLKPGFEVMGNPGGVFSDFSNETQLVQLRKFMQDLLENFQSKVQSFNIFTRDRNIGTFVMLVLFQACMV